MTTLDAGLVPARRLVVSPVDARFALVPGDRPLVVPGDSVVVGAPTPFAKRSRGRRRRATVPSKSGRSFP